MGSESGGSAVPQSQDCPETRTVALVDVAAAGNGIFALTLLQGSAVVLAPDGNRYQAMAEGLTLGWLPGDISNLLRRCTQGGYAYTATLLDVDGLAPNPQIRVAVQRL